MSQGIAKSEKRVESPADEPVEPSMLVDSKTLLEELTAVSERIAQKAYEFFETKGRQIGGEIEDWLHAECELLRPVLVEISETEDELKVRAEVPGFTAKELKLSVEPRRIILSGKMEQSAEGASEKIVYTERRREEILRTVDLPMEVDPERVTAKLQNGVLVLALAKVKPAAPVEVLVEGPPAQVDVPVK
jgi:HSP20 family molecular chaperone IbpA